MKEYREPLWRRVTDAAAEVVSSFFCAVITILLLGWIFVHFTLPPHAVLGLQ
jgi:uncharacterized membrane protein